MRNLLVAIVAIATISAFGRDLPILNGRLEGDLNANGHMVTNLAPPTATNDAATKGYVDAATNGIVVPTSWNAQSNTLDGVRRLDDMAVRTNAVTYSEWTWTSTNADLQASLIENNVVPVYIEDVGIEGHWIVAPMEANQWEVWDSYLSGVDSTAVVFPWWNPSFGIYDATATRTITTNIVVIDRIATTSDVNAAIADAAPDLSHLATKTEVAAKAPASITNDVNAIAAHLGGEDARFVSTNYDSVVHMPEASVEVKVRDGTNYNWLVVWREMTRWNWLINDYLPSNYISVADWNFKADTDWGKYDSFTGNLSPSNYLQISHKHIVISAGMAYQRHIVTGGAVWILQSNGMEITGGETNGFFRVTDALGNTQFEIIRGDNREIDADVAQVSVDGYSLVATYNVNVQPKIYVAEDIESPPLGWKREDEVDCPAVVTWETISGGFRATITPSGPRTQLFAFGKYTAGGVSYINNTLPVGFSQIIIGGTNYNVHISTISGQKVLTLTEAL